jgi:DEAD/DEAH box helicase domain-containing protein
VQELDLTGRVAVVEEANPDYYTQARTITDIQIADSIDHRRIDETSMDFGGVSVTDQVASFVRRWISTNEVIDETPLLMPPITLETRAVWWTIPSSIIARAAVAPRDLPGAIHAAEHAAIGLLPLVATCDRWDIGGVSAPLHPDTGGTTIFVYDGYPGGAGIAERGFHDAERWLRATLETIRNCPCSRGCPSCVQSPKCGNGNEPLDKEAAASLLAAILGGSWG